MVTDKNFFDTPLARYRLGVFLIWVGVLSWAPFILLRIAGQKPSPLWFLPFHLLGVIGPPDNAVSSISSEMYRPMYLTST